MVTILEKLDCHSIKEYTTEFRCGLPGHESKNKVSVKKDSLLCMVYGSENTIRGDIITLIMEISNIGFIKALKWLHEILGLEFKKVVVKKEENKKDPLHIFKRIKRRIYAKKEVCPLNEDALRKYQILPHINWIKEGIVPSVQKSFEIAYDHRSKRILIPHRHWSTGELVGVIGRTTVENHDLFDIPKYFPIHSYPKSQNVFGLYQNYAAIQREGKVIVFESEKSVLKAATYGYNNSVAVCGIAGGKFVNDQVQILIGLNVDIILALDKGISEEVNKNICRQFKGIRNAGYIWDDHGLLDDKDAPIDKGLKRWKYLLKRGVKKI